MSTLRDLAATDRPAFIRARKILQSLNRKEPAKLTKVSDHVPQNENEPHGVWRSRDFLVAAYLDGKNLRLTVNRVECDNRGEWKDGITWDELMECKRQCGYGRYWAVEVFPADSCIVNVSNMRHLWIVEQPAFAWTDKKVESSPACPRCRQKMPTDYESATGMCDDCDHEDKQALADAKSDLKGGEA